jgi:hypothetical protein
MLFTILVVIFFILVVSSQLGVVESRPLKDEQFGGLYLQFLPRGQSKPSRADDHHTN